MDWSSVVNAAVTSYNNTTHSVIGMTPNDAWNSCFYSDPDTMSEDVVVNRLHTLCTIKERTIKRYRSRYDRAIAAGTVGVFSVGDIVLVRAPDKYRSSSLFVWGRKAIVNEVLVDAVGVATFQYKISWLETSGFRKSEPPYSQARYSIHCSDLKPFYLGEDRFIEPPTVDDEVVHVVPRDDSLDHDEGVVHVDGAGGDEVHDEVNGVDDDVSPIIEDNSQSTIADDTDGTQSTDHSNQHDDTTSQQPTTKMVSRKNRPHRRRNRRTDAMTPEVPELERMVEPGRRQRKRLHQIGDFAPNKRIK